MQVPSTENFIFDSYIECGNLEKVHKRSNTEFDLILKPDTNTRRHAHWFMFNVYNKTPGHVKFNILNFMKRKSLIKKGMKPVVYSKTLGLLDLDNVVYTKTFEDSKEYYTVSFELSFNVHDDICTFSLCRPYRYTDLLNMFKEIEQVNELQPSVEITNDTLTYKRNVLCKSLGGLPVYVVTVSSGKDDNSANKKKAAVFTARVHPSETVASYVIESFLIFLIGTSPQAVALRHNFVFKIIPMLNPDGVVCGNSRTSLSGHDLNRVWIDPDPKVDPCVYYTKHFIKNLTKKYEISIYSDFHGHGKKLGSFIYGCNKIVNGSFASWTKVRLFPRIVAKNTALFAYNNCIFSINPKKEGTGRVVVWKEIGISNSFTIESSLYGYHNGEKIVPYTLENYTNLGQDIGKSLLEYTILLKSLEKDLQLTNGWLKPSKFKEISGTPALQLLTKKLEIERKEQKNIDIRDRARSSNRPSSKSSRIRIGGASDGLDANHFPDWKSYFSSEEVRIAQHNIQMGIESSIDSSSTEGSSSEDISETRVSSPIVEDVCFYVQPPHPLKSIKKELDPSRCKFIKQHASDFSDCYIENIILKNISSDSFSDCNRNMFFSRAERSRIHNEKIAKTRSMSNKKNSKTTVEPHYSYVNEKILKNRPKIQKSYYFSRNKQYIQPSDLCVSSFRVSPAKRDSLKKL